MSYGCCSSTSLSRKTNQFLEINRGYSSDDSQGAARLSSLPVSPPARQSRTIAPHDH